jgi:sarcosine oxidase subunit beta
MSHRPDVIIVGAGIIGCAIAFELGKRSYQTLNVDKLPAAGFGSSSNTCAIVRFHYSTWDGVAMAYENLFYWKEWEEYIGPVDDRGHAKYVQSGSVILRRQETDFQKHIVVFDEIGIPYELWDLETIHKRLPLLNLKDHWPPRALEDEAFWNESNRPLFGALFTPQTGYVNDPQLSTYNLMLAAKRHGGRFLFNREVNTIRQKNGRIQGVALTDGEQIDAPIVVNAAGPHSFVINRLAGVEASMNIRTRALRHEVHHVPSPLGYDFEKDGYHVSDTGNGVYFRPEIGNTILVGSEDPECDERIWVDDPDLYNTQLTKNQWEIQVYRLAKRIPDLRIPSQPRGLVDLYDVSDDWIPIYDRSELDGFYMAVGTSGNQFKNAAGVGHLMAELIHACENGQNHDTHQIQVRMPNTGLVLNAGFYSRLREINEDSSFSVLG